MRLKLIMEGKGCMWSVVSNRPKAWSRFLKVRDLQWSLIEFKNWFRFWFRVLAFSQIVEQKWEVKARNGRLTLIIKRLHIKRREDVDLPISQWQHTVSTTPNRVGFGVGLVSKGEIMVLEWQIGERSKEFELRSEPFFSFDEKVGIWCFTFTRLVFLSKKS